MAARKLVLCVIDSLAPAMLERAVAEGAVPTLAALMRRGSYFSACAAAFPSVTPVCAAAMLTGVWQERHRVPGMNWYSRAADRYVEYGSSLRAAQRFGIARQLTDTVYNLNQAHLAPEMLTVFEALDDAQVRTACTTYLIYRGRHIHEPRRDGLLTRLAAPLMRHPVSGPQELFYADVFASRPAPCTSMLGMPGVRDRHSGCTASYLVEHDLYDFLLLSLPDNDWYSHKHGPEGQIHSLAQADAQIRRVFDAGGGLDAFLDENAVVVMGDHSQVPIERAIPLVDELGDLGVLAPSGGAGGSVAVCPSQRAAMLYLLDEERAAGGGDDGAAALARRALAIDGVELACRLRRDGDGDGEAVVQSAGGELRFAPGGELADRRGRLWSVEGALDALGARVEDGRIEAPLYPDALSRLWSALACPTSGDVLLSAAPGHEFLDWGGQAHARGGSHGSLRAGDSLTALILCGLETAPEPDEWTICDIAPLLCAHFGATLTPAPAP